MFVLIWAILLLSVSGLAAGKPRRGSSGAENPDCDNDKSCTTSNEADITAEAGLCVVIPCTVKADIDVKSIIWHKCKGTSNKQIFKSHGNETTESDYKGRVLQPYLGKENCSIIINDLTNSDSGSYYSIATDNKKNICTTLSEKTITVTDLSQKPIMVIPPLTEGQKATLTCTAPGLCSGSPPNITWMWRGAGGNDSYIPGNISAVKTENLTAVTRRHSSTLTFISSAEHHNANVTCKVSFKGGSTEETKTLNVTHKGPITEPPKDQSPTTVKRVNCNNVEEANTKDLFAAVLSTIQQLHGIIVLLIGFVMGMLLSTIIACLVIKCLGKKQRRSRFLPENMELVIAQSVPDLMDVGPIADYDVIRVQDAAEGGDESSGPSAPDGDMRPKEVEYSNIDFSKMKRRNPTGAEETRDTAETEYAEIKKEATEERPDNGGEDGEVLEGNEEEKVVMIGEDEEAKQGMAAEEDGGEDAALYSNVNEAMDEV